VRTGFIAALLAALTLGFAEGLGRFYPARKTWDRLRSTQGRAAVRAMRERMEAASRRRTPYIFAGLLLALVVAWVAASSLLDKRWWEVVIDVFPYTLVAVTVLRVPAILRSIASRMRSYEQDFGEGEDKRGPQVGAMP
jgi:hypothetical protein